MVRMGGVKWTSQKDNNPWTHGEILNLYQSKVTEKRKNL